MARGRPPKPTALKQLSGNPGKRALPSGEPSPRKKGRTPSPPRYLGSDGKREWRRVAGELYRLGLLTSVDETALTSYCQQYDLYCQARELVESGGVVMMSGNGTPMPNPAVGVMRGALSEMQRIGAKFGLTPSDRARLGVSAESAADPVEDMLFNVPKPQRSA